MLGQFEFSGFKKARRGEVRIDVTFEINSDGIVNVTACDQETGQQASTQITLSSGLSEEEIGQIIDEGRTERVRSDAAEADSPAAASSPAPPAEEEPSDELELLPDAGDLLEEPSDLEIDDGNDETMLAAEAEEEEADPNAATQPDLEPLAISAALETAGEVEFEAAGLEATPAEDLFDAASTELSQDDDESER